MTKPIPAPKGFTALGKAAGFKADGALDLMVLASDVPANVGGVFTRNRVLGAPVVVSREHVAGGKLRAIVANSRIANVGCGEDGLEIARQTCRLAAEALGCEPQEIGVASTGVIGRVLPIEKMEAGLAGVGDQLTSFDIESAAQAIMTTDTHMKISHAEVDGATLVGIAKGSGMISPNMATMLGFIVTDADIDSFILTALLREATDKSFNRVSVDTDMSTSDMVLLMANGQAGKVEQKKFALALDKVCMDLAKQIARDGEGATKLIEVSVTGAGDEGLAMRVARAVVNSPLVKTAVYGADPNWGRVLAAAGKIIDPRIEEAKLSVKFGEEYVFFQGAPIQYDEEKIVAHMKGEEVKIGVDLGRGSAWISMYGCDLSEGYVKINADYTT